jgi:hypothetical protein
LERFLAGVAVLMSAATVGAAFLFRFDGYYSAFSRLTQSLGFAFGYWVAAVVMAALIYVAGQLLRFRAPMLEIFFVLVAGTSMVGILESLR